MKVGVLLLTLIKILLVHLQLQALMVRVPLLLHRCSRCVHVRHGIEQRRVWLCRRQRRRLIQVVRTRNGARR
jgi:hypothetical protein